MTEKRVLHWANRLYVSCNPNVTSKLFESHGFDNPVEFNISWTTRKIAEVEGLAAADIDMIMTGAPRVGEMFAQVWKRSDDAYPQLIGRIYLVGRGEELYREDWPACTGVKYRTWTILTPEKSA